MTCKRDDKGNFLDLDDDDDEGGHELTLTEAMLVHQVHQFGWNVPKPYAVEAAFWCGVAAVLDMRNAYPSDFMRRVKEEHDRANVRFEAKLEELAKEHECPAHADREDMRLVARWEREGEDDDWHELRHDGCLYWVWKEDNHGSMPERVITDLMALGVHQGVISSLNALNYGTCPELRRTR